MAVDLYLMISEKRAEYFVSLTDERFTRVTLHGFRCWFVKPKCLIVLLYVVNTDE